MKRMVFCALSLGAWLLMPSLVLANDFQLEFKAQLRGQQQVPSVGTSTKGSIEISFNEGFTAASFKLKVTKGVEITTAHIHCAAAGENGPVAVLLFDAGAAGVDVDGTLIEAKIRNRDIVSLDGSLPCGVVINNIASLYAALRAGRLYVNVHSVANADGVVRGQLVPGRGSDD